MDQVLRESLEPVLRDLEAGGLAPPRLEADNWTADPERPSAMMWDAGGGGTGVRVDRSAPLLERVVSVADQVQDWVIEAQLWGARPTNWPRCPRHPDTHPLRASASDGAAVWSCPADGTVISSIGGL